MATLLDSFILELGWDTKPLEKGRKEAETNIAKTKSAFTKAGKEMEDSAKSVAAGISKIATEILILYAAITGANSLKGFIADLVSANTQLGNFANTLGASPQTIDAWGKAAERVGGSADATAGSFQKISDALNALHTQGQTLPLAFYQLMAAANRPIDTEHGPVKFMQDLAKAANVLAQTDPSKAAYYLKAIGIDQGTIALMLQGGSALDTYVKSLEKLAPTQAQIQASRDLYAAWEALVQTATSLGNTVLPILDKALTPVLKAMAEWVDKNRDLINSKVDEILTSVADALQRINWQAVTKGMGDFASAANATASAIKTIADGIVTISSYSDAFDKFMQKAQNPLGLKPGENVISHFAQTKGDGVDENGVRNVPGVIGPGPVDGHKASGGSVGAGKRYLVGERGPELLQLGSAGGSITPNHALGGDLQVQGRSVDHGNPVPVALVRWGNDINDMFFGGSADLGYTPDGNNMGSGGGGRPRHPGSGGYGSNLGGAVSLTGSNAEVVAYIRQAAIKRGIDPDIALRVAASEGLRGYDPTKPDHGGDLGTSFGPFQLHYGGLARGMMNGGLGDTFTRTTGLNARNPNTWKQQVDFALDQARKGGWSPWHGASAHGIYGYRGIGALPSGAGAAAKARGGGSVGAGGLNTSSISNETNVTGPITIHTMARDARGIAMALSDQIRRTTMTATANYGPA
ncbi:hypothetical protein ACMDCR_25820 [Labrys okinawensis]|uniref:hypothetical protein n=1 Tax=Labrys okinawensis TaxID=346911 RepID=UPI0039BD5206